MSNQTCKRCNKQLLPAAATGRPRIYCSNTCKQTAYDGRKWGYNREEIVAEHGDVCYLCQSVVNLAGRGPQAPCVDHVLPLAAGGNNHIENLRIVHLVCNLRKGDRLFCSHCGHNLGLRF